VGRSEVAWHCSALAFVWLSGAQVSTALSSSPAPMSGLRMPDSLILLDKRIPRNSHKYVPCAKFCFPTRSTPGTVSMLRESRPRRPTMMWEREG
jgi:hypothetical protein